MVNESQAGAEVRVLTVQREEQDTIQDARADDDAFFQVLPRQELDGSYVALADNEGGEEQDAKDDYCYNVAGPLAI